MDTLPRIQEAEELIVNHSRTELRALYFRRIWRLQELQKLHAPACILTREVALMAESRRAWLMCCE